MFRYLYVWIIVVGCRAVGFAQPTISAEAFRDRSRLSVGLVVSPDYCFRSLLNGDGSEDSDVVIGIRDDIESGKFGYTGGVCARWHYSYSLAFEAGLVYANRGYAIKSTDLVYSVVVDPRYNLPGTSGGAVSGPDAVSIDYDFNYLELPVRVIYFPADGKIKPVVSIGVAAGYLLDSPQTVTYEAGAGAGTTTTTGQGFAFNKFNLSIAGSTGFQFGLSGPWALSVEPTFRYGVLKIIDAPVTGHLWSVGMQASLLYTLKGFR